MKEKKGVAIRRERLVSLTMGHLNKKGDGGIYDILNFENFVFKLEMSIVNLHSI
jgi:hypothetical protein